MYFSDFNTQRMNKEGHMSLYSSSGSATDITLVNINYNY